LRLVTFARLVCGVEEQSTNRGSVGPTADVKLAALFDVDRRHRNVQGLSAGVLVCAATILSFVPISWFFMREHFVLIQGGSTLWLASLLGTWLLIRKRPEWTLGHIDDLVFGLFLFVSMYSDFQVWIDYGYDSPYVLTLMFGLVGVNFFISWSAKRSAAFSLAVYAVFIAPLMLGLVPLGHARTAVIYQAVLLCVSIIVVGFQRHRFQLEFREFRWKRSPLGETWNEHTSSSRKSIGSNLSFLRMLVMSCGRRSR